MPCGGGLARLGIWDFAGELANAGDKREGMAAMIADLGFFVERVTRIELALSAWEADVLPLNYTRGASDPAGRRLPPGGRVEPVPTSYRNR
jgi:hypothetical protein